MAITSKWKTVATVGYNGGVSRNENRAAHGGVCHLEARRSKGGFLGRKTNSNGQHYEVGEPFPLDAETLARWESISAASR